MAIRSSIDFLSNRTILRGFSEPREIFMAALGIYPDYTLPQFLHELTHHWCFESPVGLAICLLQLEAAKLMLAGERKPSVRQRSRDCLVKAEIALLMLGPIAEGISLFAEFDQMVTSHGKLVSAPISLISVLFGKQREYISEHLARSTSAMGESVADYLASSDKLSTPRTSQHGRAVTRRSSPFSSIHSSPHVFAPYRPQGATAFLAISIRRRLVPSWLSDDQERMGFEL